MAGRLNQSYAVTRMRRTEDGTGWEEDTRADSVTAEEPLEIRVGHQTITTTLNLPMASCIPRATFARSKTSLPRATAPVPMPRVKTPTTFWTFNCPTTLS